MTHEVMSKCFGFGQREFDTRETLKLLYSYQSMFWSWGASGFKNLDDKVLVFKVNGHHHKGYVCINLGWNDTYTVRLISTQGNVKFEQEGVYFDVLFDTLDVKIEKIERYRF